MQRSLVYLQSLPCSRYCQAVASAALRSLVYCIVVSAVLAEFNILLFLSYCGYLILWVPQYGRVQKPIGSPVERHKKSPIGGLFASLHRRIFIKFFKK